VAVSPVSSSPVATIPLVGHRIPTKFRYGRRLSSTPDRSDEPSSVGRDLRAAHGAPSHLAPCQNSPLRVAPPLAPFSLCACRFDWPSEALRIAGIIYTYRLVASRHQKSTKCVKGRVSGSTSVRSTAHWCRSSAGDTDSSFQPRLAKKNDVARAIAGS